MSKRKRRSYIHAGSLPLLLDGIADAYDTIPGIRGGDLWWITRPMAEMTTVAAEDQAAEDLPPLQQLVPSDSGLLWVDAGTGLSVHDSGSHRDEHVYGLGWFHHDGLRLVLLTRRPESYSDIPGRHGTDAGIVLADLDHPAAAYRLDRIDRWLATALLLAEQPTIARVRRNPTPANGAGRAPSSTSISIVTLREAFHSPADSAEESADSGRRLHTRHIVRGHWRNQACGPDRAERRKIYVPPFVRGPEDSPLIRRPRVHVWRR